MDEYMFGLIESVKASYSSYKRALREYLDSSYIDENGELIYPVNIAALVHDKKEEFEEAVKNLQISKSIRDFEY